MMVNDNIIVEDGIKQTGPYDWSVCKEKREKYRKGNGYMWFQIETTELV